MIKHRNTHHWSNRSGKSIQTFVEELQENSHTVVDIIFYDGETKAFVITVTELWTPGDKDDYND